MLSSVWLCAGAALEDGWACFTLWSLGTLRRHTHPPRGAAACRARLSSSCMRGACQFAPHGSSQARVDGCSMQPEDRPRSTSARVPGADRGGSHPPLGEFAADLAADDHARAQERIEPSASSYLPADPPVHSSHSQLPFTPPTHTSYSLLPLTPPTHSSHAVPRQIYDGAAIRAVRVSVMVSRITFWSCHL